ncbi:conserved hypothetical protein [Ricinus communis]|uniref:Uncharacterized protein n=1 Tax=Ricinus communis TaxID=3988 RepID=B9SY34_RICCO|nr:conserved hypothetical protein [Ricinus communis]
MRVRDHHVDLINGVARRMMANSALVGEALALSGCESGQRHRREGMPWEIEAVILDIAFKCKDYLSFSFSHSTATTNFVADYIAKAVLTQSPRHMMLFTAQEWHHFSSMRTDISDRKMNRRARHGGCYFITFIYNYTCFSSKKQ